MVNPINFSMEDIDKIVVEAQRHGIDYNDIVGWVICVIKDPRFHHTNGRLFKPIMAHRKESYNDDPLKYPTGNGTGILVYMSFNSFKVAYEYSALVRAALYSEKRQVLEDYLYSSGKSFTQSIYYVVNQLSGRTASDWIEYDNQCNKHRNIDDYNDYLIKVLRETSDSGAVYDRLDINKNAITGTKQYNSIVHKLVLLNNYREQLLIDIYAIIKHYTPEHTVSTIEELDELFSNLYSNPVLSQLTQGVDIDLDYIGTNWFKLKGTFDLENIYEIDLFSTQESSVLTNAREALFSHLIKDRVIYDASVDRYYNSFEPIAPTIASREASVAEQEHSPWYKRLFKW